jgi:MFS family permease
MDKDQVNQDSEEVRESEDVATPPTILPTRKSVPYPSGQLFVLGCCRLSEPITMTSASPYMFFMIRDFHITEDETQIGRYAGFLSSCYSIGQFLSGSHSKAKLMLGIMWGRLSDTYGRKPIVLCGIVGTILATLVFGFSKSYTQAMLGRSMAGLLNGNVGVIRTMVAEMNVAKSDQARAFSVMPFVSNIGSICGPILGGW